MLVTEAVLRNISKWTVISVLSVMQLAAWVIGGGILQYELLLRLPLSVLVEMEPGLQEKLPGKYPR